MDYTFDNFCGRDPSHLIEVAEFKNCRLTAPTAEAFLAMCKAAQQDGIDLAPASSFRDFDRQLTIWNEKYMGDRTVLDNHGQPVNIGQLTGIEAAYAILYWSALPGFSRHHWGTDLDVYSPALMPENYELQLVAAEYDKDGIFHPLTSELWHISYRSEAEKFLPFVTRKNIEDLIRSSPIAGKYCLLNMVDELYDDYIINETNKDQHFNT